MEKMKQGRPLLKDENKRCIIRSYTIKKDLFATFKAKIELDTDQTISGLITEAFEQYLNKDNS